MTEILNKFVTYADADVTCQNESLGRDEKTCVCARELCLRIFSGQVIKLPSLRFL
jgi:hypothetical protein